MTGGDFNDLVRSCLYNWLGYGNLDGSIWFMGTEEGGAEIWRQSTQTLTSSLRLRSNFGLAMDFRSVWENDYRIPLETFSGPTVWRYMAAFLLEMRGVEASKDSIHALVYTSKQLGRPDSDHFMCELLPLPKRAKNAMEDYRSVWPSIAEYHKEVVPRRFELIRNTILAHRGVRLVVSYERLLTERMLAHFREGLMLLNAWVSGEERYELYRIAVAHDRQLYLLSTPFFGNGRISYGGLRLSAGKVRSYL